MAFVVPRQLAVRGQPSRWVGRAARSRSQVESLLRIITALEFEIDLFTRLVGGRLREDPGYRAIQQIPGVGPVLAALFVAEIGDITRFHRPAQLTSWAGLTPKHH